MDLLVVIAGLVGLVWGGLVLLRGGLVAGCLLVLLAGTCFGYPFFSLPTGAIPFTADRALWVVLMVQYAVWRRWGWADPKPLGSADVVLAALVAWLAASTFTHDWQSHNHQPVSRLLFYYLMPLGLYWVARQAAWTPRAAWTTFGFLAAMGVYLALTAVAEARQVTALVFPAYIASPVHREFFGRARGPMLNPAGLGIYLGIGLCAVLMAWPRCRRFGRLGLLAAAALVCAGIYSTYTRSCWMGAAAAWAVVAGLALPRTWRAALLAGGLLVGSAVAVTQWENLLAFKRDKELSAQETADSAALRPILATVAWHMFLDRPLLGCGFAHYVEEKNAYLADRSTDLPLEKARAYIQHNVWLALLTETGLVGMALFTAVVVAWAGAAWRLWRAEEAPLWARQQGLMFLGALAVYLPNAMFHDVSLIPTVHMLLFFVAGATVGIRQRVAPGRTEPSGAVQ